ncbi:MAG: PP2C family protein-serine/threonine phosphatase [Ignavibacteriales bacterium]|nr:PP2C family protein-serine/threonine phosphatase [Ignavibacteriales bacterium]
MDDFRRGDFERTMRRDFSELKDFMLTEERQKRLKEMKQVKRWLFIAWWFLEGLFLKLTPARRILLLLAILLLISNVSVRTDGQGSSFEGFHFIGALVLLFIIMLELKDKLLAHEELEAGHAVQNALMPERTPQVPGWSLWLYTRSANEVGGDLVDFIQITPQRIGITLGDIAGKGLRAALLTAKLQATIRALVPDVISLDALASKLNFIFCRDSLPNLFASVVYVEIQPDSGSVRMVNSGHFPPVILRGGQIEKTEKGGIALGLSSQSTFHEQYIELGKGETMVIYSDGLTEARNLEGAFLGEQRILDLLPQLTPYSAEQIGDRLLQEVDRFIGEARAFDDVSIAILKRI